MSIAQAVLSEALAEAIDGRTVVAAVFTTFTFEPEFFELHVLPILFDEAFSQVDKVRRVQLEECLSRVESLAVYYDRTGLVGDARPVSLDFRRIDVRRNGIFHPKLALILVENPPEDHEEDAEPAHSLVVATLSANLTRAGWWENVEAGHVETIDPPSGSRDKCTFRQDLLDVLRSIRRASRSDENHDALDLVRAFLRREAPRRDLVHASSKGRLFTRMFVGQATLGEWLRELRLQRWDWNLEVISPFFDGHGAGALAELVKAVRPRAVRVLLPEEPDGTALVTSDQYEAIAEHATWGRLPNPIVQGGRSGLRDALPRRVHAKVYRFWSREAGEVVLVGSVNLTRAAHGKARAGNLEAAFLVDLTEQNNPARWWLDPLDGEPSAFVEPTPAEERDAQHVLVDLSVRYDWRRHALELQVDKDHEGELWLETVAGEPVLTVHDLRAGAWQPCGGAAADHVRDLLVSTSFLQARVAAGSWRVLLREEGMTHKPSLLAQLTPEEILQYWSLLSPAQRQSFLVERLEANETLDGLQVRPGRVGRLDTLFDRFAGLYHAFEHLYSWIEERLDEGRERPAIARLFGASYDSLPVLLEKTLASEDGDPVLRYVTFLSARQVRDRIAAAYQDFWQENRDDVARLDELLARSDDLRAALPLEEDDRETFLEWYEASFLTHASEVVG